MLGKAEGGIARALGGEFPQNTPDQFAAFLTTDAARWLKVIKDINLQLD